MYEIREVKTFRQALQLRKLRNECRKFMTRDQREIGLWDQWWYWRHWPEGRKAYLVYRGEVPVAFGVINPNRSITGGVAEAWRGEGLGRMIFSHLTQLVPKPAWLEVLQDNLVARNLYESLGWEYSEEWALFPDVSVMTYR